jgi:hypothetical protein
LRHRSTTGLDHDRIRELTTRIRQVLATPGGHRGRPATLGVSRSVLLTLMPLRQNLPQTVAGDLSGISQPTVSRIFRRFLPLIEQVPCLHTPPLPQAPAGRVVLVDGTLIATGKRAGHDRANYSGKRHKARPCRSDSSMISAGWCSSRVRDGSNGRPRAIGPTSENRSRPDALNTPLPARLQP